MPPPKVTTKLVAVIPEEAFLAETVGVPPVHPRSDPVLAETPLAPAVDLVAAQAEEELSEREAAELSKAMPDWFRRGWVYQNRLIAQLSRRVSMHDRAIFGSQPPPTTVTGAPPSIPSRPPLKARALGSELSIVELGKRLQAVEVNSAATLTQQSRQTRALGLTLDEAATAVQRALAFVVSREGAYLLIRLATLSGVLWGAFTLARAQHMTSPSPLAASPGVTAAPTGFPSLAPSPSSATTGLAPAASSR